MELFQDGHSLKRVDGTIFGVFGTPEDAKLVRSVFLDVREGFLEMLEWCEQEIGHDGAPDGGDPSWVRTLERTVCKMDGCNWPPDMEYHLRAVFEARRRQTT